MADTWIFDINEFSRTPKPIMNDGRRSRKRPNGVDRPDGETAARGGFRGKYTAPLTQYYGCWFDPVHRIFVRFVYAAAAKWGKCAPRPGSWPPCWRSPGSHPRPRP